MFIPGAMHQLFPPVKDLIFCVFQALYPPVLSFIPFNQLIDFKFISLIFCGAFCDRNMSLFIPIGIGFCILLQM
ncbi:hypothetical protein Dda3937_03041 [Dickeya dadantii 3937]|uniref:Uncharacterized protein n=1 Tax=Dickeya dadantii (strain 3937) TaxID=198628 RepID=E0SLE1_DICD3|nr:hypothetical protein Dda3937_03041 [Dickeya dadantii 3937]